MCTSAFMASITAKSFNQWLISVHSDNLIGMTLFVGFQTLFLFLWKLRKLDAVKVLLETVCIYAKGGSWTIGCLTAIGNK